MTYGIENPEGPQPNAALQAAREEIFSYWRGLKRRSGQPPQKFFTTGPGLFVRRCVIGVVLLFRMLQPRVSAPYAVTALCCVMAVSASTTAAAEVEKRTFNLPRGDAALTLKQFAAAAGTPIIYLVDRVRGATTNAVRGELTPHEALERMLVNSGLEAAQDGTTGAFVVSRIRSEGKDSPVPNPHPQPKTQTMKSHRTLLTILAGWIASATITVAQTTTPAPASSTSSREEAIVLSPFQVSTIKDNGYRKLSSVTTSRVGVSLYEAPQAIEIISGELLHDMGYNSIREVYDYTSSVTVNKQETRQNGSFKLRGFQLPQYINGVQVAANSNGPGYVSSDNVDRVEIAKGPVGLFYGNSSPNGVSNVVTKRPQNVNRTTIETTAGSNGLLKALVDTQAVVSREYGISYRLVAAADNSQTRLNQNTSYNMYAASLVIRPNDKIEVQAEFNHTNYYQAYSAVSAWNFLVNPLYYEQVANPDQTMLNYIKTKYGAADDAAARTVIASRWGINGPKNNTYLNTNWVGDYYGAYGKVTYPFIGSSTNWNRYSPDGDKFTSASPDSRLDGLNTLADVSVRITPFQKTALQYHWVQSRDQSSFDRSLAFPNPGALDTNGRVPSLNVFVQSQLLDAVSDTQQLDFSQEVTTGGIKNHLLAGLEARRIWTNNGSATTDASKAPTRTTPSGGTTTGQGTLSEFYNFSNPWTAIKPLIVSGITQVKSKPTEYQDWYASYRGTAFGDKLNLLAGVRNVKQNTTGLISTGQSELTKSLGVIGQVVPGLYAFGSYSETFQFADAYNVNTTTGAPIAGESVPLNSETGDGFEIGLKSALFGEKLSGTISYFNVNRDGVVLADIQKNLTDPRNNDSNTNNDVRFNQNGGLQLSKGIDADLVWTPTSDFQLLANFTYLMEAKVVSDPSVNTVNIGINEPNARKYDKLFNHRLAKSPKLSANVVGKYTFNDGKFKGSYVGAGIRRTGEYEVSDNEVYGIQVKAETIFDAFVGYNTKIGKIPTSFQLNARNLTNKINDVTRDDGLVLQTRVSMQF